MFSAVVNLYNRLTFKLRSVLVSEIIKRDVSNGYNIWIDNQAVVSGPIFYWLFVFIHIWNIGIRAGKKLSFLLSYNTWIKRSTFLWFLLVDKFYQNINFWNLLESKFSVRNKAIFIQELALKFVFLKFAKLFIVNFYWRNFQKKFNFLRSKFAQNWQGNSSVLCSELKMR